MKQQQLWSSGEDKRDYISELPEDLLLKIWKHLAALPPDPLTERETILQHFPFRTLDNPCEPHPGLRAYPFLGQVCKQWKQMLDKPEARRLIWDEIVVDFSHELITAVHTPIAWSDKRPSNEEFQKSFKEIQLSTSKILDFIHARKSSIKRIVLMSSEGYFSEEGEFINFVNKHDFSMIGFGMMCGMLMDSLEELTVMRCNDFFDLSTWGSTAIQSLRRLKCLRLEEVKCSGENMNIISRLSNLSRLTELALTTDSYSERWLGTEKSPSCWLGLSSLQKLTLSGHSHFWRIPTDFARLPLTYLDLSLSKVSDFTALRTVTGLKVLSLQSVVRQAEHAEIDLQANLLAELTHLTNLTALNLSENWFTCIPSQLSTLTKLEYLDLNSNEHLQAARPLTALYGLTQLKLVDIRFVHKEPHISYWSSEKCDTITNLVAWQKVLRRRGANVKFFLDGGS